MTPKSKANPIGSSFEDVTQSASNSVLARQTQILQSEERMNTLRAALISAEENGFTNQTVTHIWSEARGTRS